MGRIARAAVFLTILCVALSLHAAVTYKDPTNPTGLPDLTQMNLDGVPPRLDSAICLAAAGADALWYFDHLTIEGGRKFPGLVAHTDPTHSETNWGPDGYRLVRELADEIYTQGRGFDGILRYIQKKRPGKDLEQSTRIYRVGNTQVVETNNYWKWQFDQMSGGDVNEYSIQQASKVASRVGILLAQWHETGKPEGEFMTSNGQTIGHQLVVAGHSDQGKQLILAHGWEDHWKDPKNATTPVDYKYYDAYSYEAKDGSRVRITDKTLIDKAGGLGERKPDYAAVTQLSNLRTDSSVYFGLKSREYFPFPQRALPDALSKLELEFFVYNDSDTAINRTGLELPLLDPEAFSPDYLTDVVLPPGWSYRIWDPSSDATLPDMVTDQGILNWFGYDHGWKGVLFESTSDFIYPHTGLEAIFSLPSHLLDSTALETRPLSTGAWTSDHNIAYFGLAVITLDEPPSIVILVVGAALLSSGLRRWRAVDHAP